MSSSEVVVYLWVCVCVCVLVLVLTPDRVPSSDLRFLSFALYISHPSRTPFDVLTFSTMTTWEDDDPFDPLFPPRISIQ
jgi:hypothetical protein